MNDVKLLRIALIIGMVGIISLFFLSKAIQAEPTEISKITEEEIGRKVMVEGIVEKIEQKKSVTILEISEQGTKDTVSVALFGNKLNIPEQGEKVKITGTVKEYYGTLEIVAERIEIIS